MTDPSELRKQMAAIKVEMDAEIERRITTQFKRMQGKDYVIKMQGDFEDFAKEAKYLQERMKQFSAAMESPPPPTEEEIAATIDSIKRAASE